MPIIKPINKISPQIADNVFLAENCVVIGDVKIAKGSSIWYNVVIRGDVNYIRIGENTNIQDGTVIHATYKKYPTIIGNNVSIGHRAIIHACTIEDNVLIGMGAIIMDNAKIASNSLIAAGSVVVPNTIVEPNSVYAGIPARKIKSVDKNNSELINGTASRYKLYTTWYEENDS